MRYQTQGYIGFIKKFNVSGKKQGLTINLDYPADYKKLLNEALKHGYKFIRIEDYYVNYHNKGLTLPKKTIIMRHDIDRDPRYALKMASLEYSLGIKSTYYFRWCTVDPQIIKKIKLMGHEVGLHYETLAKYAEIYRINKASNITPEIILKFRAALKQEIKVFSLKYGKIKTIASHGHPKNRQLGLNNHLILRGENLLDYNILGMAESIPTSYTISDTGGVWSNTFTPLHMIKDDRGPIKILIHPVWWNQYETENKFFMCRY